MRLSRTVRNVSAVVLAFLFVAVLVVLVRLRPPTRIMPPAPAELERIRFSPTENAWFVLQDAVSLIPEKPFVDPRTTVDFEFGVMGSFTGIYLPDDHPDHVAWVKASIPAVDRARGALKMEHLLMAIEAASTEKPWDRIYESNDFHSLPSIMLALAARETKAGDHQVASDCFQDAWRLLIKLRESIPGWWGFGPTSLCKLVRQFDPQVQKEALAFLIDLSPKATSCRQAVEEKLRLYEAWRGSWFNVYSPQDLTLDVRAYQTVAMVRSGPAKRVLAANLNAILDASSLTENEYDVWSRQFPKLANAAEYSFPNFEFRYIGYENTQTVVCFDVVKLVLAIELYRHTHGGYPASLDELAPEFLPKVPLNADCRKPYYYKPAQVDYWFAIRGEGDDPSKLIYSDIVICPPESQHK